MKQTTKGSAKAVVIIILIFILFIGVFMWFLRKNVQTRAQQAVIEKQNQATAKPTQPTTSAKTPTSTNETAGWQSFSDSTLGYDIKYPNNWASSKQTDKNGIATVTFGTNINDTTNIITIQEFSGNQIVDSKVAEDFMKGAKNKIATDKGVVSEEKDFIYNFADGTNINGKQIKVAYTSDNTKEWLVVIPAGKKLIWLKLATSADKYEANYTIAKNMVDSWIIAK